MELIIALIALEITVVFAKLMEVVKHVKLVIYWPLMAYATHAQQIALHALPHYLEQHMPQNV